MKELHEKIRGNPEAMQVLSNLLHSVGREDFDNLVNALRKLNSLYIAGTRVGNSRRADSRFSLMGITLLEEIPNSELGIYDGERIASLDSNNLIRNDSGDFFSYFGAQLVDIRNRRENYYVNINYKKRFSSAICPIQIKPSMDPIEEFLKGYDKRDDIETIAVNGKPEILEEVIYYVPKLN